MRKLFLIILLAFILFNLSSPGISDISASEDLPEITVEVVS